MTTVKTVACIMGGDPNASSARTRAVNRLRFLPMAAALAQVIFDSIRAAAGQADEACACSSIGIRAFAALVLFQPAFIARFKFLNCLGGSHQPRDTVHDASVQRGLHR